MEAPPPRRRPIRALLVLGGLLVVLSALLLTRASPMYEVEVAAGPTATPTVPQVYAIVAPSTVSIRATVAGKDPANGAGVLVDDQGQILTALHVVGGATQVRVTFYDGTESVAEIVNTVPERDIAVIRALNMPAGIPPAVLGSPDRLRIGDEVFAIGDPFGLGGSFSAGVVSGLNRTARTDNAGQTLKGLIQFDAAVNPGSSGGPLVNRLGEVVGIVSGLLNPNVRSFAGVGFAVRIDSAAGGLGLPPE